MCWLNRFNQTSVTGSNDFDRIWTECWTKDSKPWFSNVLTESVQPDEPNRFESAWTILSGFEQIVESGTVNLDFTFFQLNELNQTNQTGSNDFDRIWTDSWTKDG